MNETDLLSYCVLRPGRAGQLTLPLLPGSRHIRDRGWKTPPLASPVYGPVNTAQGIQLPLIYARLPVFGEWFNQTVLYQMFARRYGDGQLVGWQTAGRFSGSLGPIQWRYASEAPVEYAACKVAKFALLFNAAGEPLEAQVLLAPYGYRARPSRIFSLGQYFGRLWTGSGLSYAGASGVWAGSLQIDNRLLHNRSSPHYDSVDGSLYPVDYSCDVYDVTLSLLQAAGAPIINDPLGSNGASFMNLGFTAPDYSSSVVARLSLLAPSKTETVQMGPGKVLRTYQAIKVDPSRPMLQFS